MENLNTDTVKSISTNAKCAVCGSTNTALFLNTKDHSISQEPFSLLKCGQCDFVFTGAPPKENEAGQYYESEVYISHSNTTKGIVNSLYHFARKFMLGQKLSLLKSSGIKKGQKVLDYGAGTGHFVNHLNQNGYAARGVEISEAARQTSLDLFSLDIQSPTDFFSHNESQFDAITMWHVLEHLYDPKKYLKNFFDRMTSGGKLIIAVPNLTSLDARHYKTHWAAYDAPRHLWHFSPKTIKVLCEEIGYKMLSVKRLPLDSFYVSLLSEKYKGGSLGLIKGLITGLRSYINALMNKSECSSLVYVFEKKHE